MTLMQEAAHNIVAGINNSRSVAHNYFPSAAAHRKTNSSDTGNNFESRTLTKMYGGGRQLETITEGVRPMSTFQLQPQA